MQDKYTKKIIGTVVMTVFLLSLALAGFSYAQAQGSNDNNKSYKFSGTVTDINCVQSIAIDVNGGITFDLNDKTTFTRGLNCGNIEIDDDVHIIAKKDINGNFVAKVVQKDNDAGYGRNW